MSWRVYGEIFETADMSGAPRVFQPFIPAKNQIVKAIRTWVIFFNSPVFSGLTMKIYSNYSNAPVSLLWTSDRSLIPADFSTEAYAAKELYFDFENPIFLRKNDTYHVTLSASGYTGNSSSHLSWMRGYPDPNNEIDVTVNQVNIGRMPFYLGVVDGLR